MYTCTTCIHVLHVCTHVYLCSGLHWPGGHAGGESGRGRALASRGRGLASREGGATVQHLPGADVAHPERVGPSPSPLLGEGRHRGHGWLSDSRWGEGGEGGGRRVMRGGEVCAGLRGGAGAWESGKRLDGVGVDRCCDEDPGTEREEGTRGEGGGGKESRQKE